MSEETEYCDCEGDDPDCPTCNGRGFWEVWSNDPDDYEENA